MTVHDIKLTCAACRVADRYPVTAVLVTDMGGGVLSVRFPCEGCLSGWQRVSHPSPRALVLASGATVRRLGETGWPRPLLGVPPDRPGVNPRTAPLYRLARMVQRRKRSEGK